MAKNPPDVHLMLHFLDDYLKKEALPKNPTVLGRRHCALARRCVKELIRSFDKLNEDVDGMAKILGKKWMISGVCPGGIPRGKADLPLTRCPGGPLMGRAQLVRAFKK